MRFRERMQRALYGPDGFYVRHRPGAHFLTSAQSPLFGGAIALLLTRVDAALGHPARLDLVDIGGGEGFLLDTVVKALPAELNERLRPRLVELGDPEVPDGITGMLLATEWLDNVPLDLARDGHYLDDGAPLSPEDAAWIQRWWPTPGYAEIGRCRDEAWRSVVGKLRAGLALTVDYGHSTGTRPASPTLAGFRDGREVEPRFDGSTDITCHVAMDSAASATGLPYRLVTQREALHALGVDGARPPLELAHTDPGAYMRRLAAAGEAAMLTDPHGLGAHWWLWHEVGIRLSA